MLKRFRILLVVFAAFAFLYSCNNRAKEIPIADFFKVADKSMFKISPDGKYVAELHRRSLSQGVPAV